MFVMLKIIERESPTLITFVEDRGFITEKYYLYCYETFWISLK